MFHHGFHSKYTYMIFQCFYNINNRVFINDIFDRVSTHRQLLQYPHYYQINPFVPNAKP